MGVSRVAGIQELRGAKEGEIWEALHDVEIQYMTSHDAPYTGGGTATLPAGERVIASKSASGRKRIGAYFDPLRYKELEEILVSKDDRDAPHYSGYYFFIPVEQLNKHFRFVEQQGLPKDETHQS